MSQARLLSVGVVVAFVFLCSIVSAQQPMSPCTEARSTYYDYAASQNGACQFGAIGGARLPFQNVAAPNEAFFNDSMACGECYEIIGPSGSVTVIVADECPVQGNVPCDGRIIHFDLGSKATYSLIAPATTGVVLQTIRKVACDVTGNMGLYFVPGTSQYYVGFVVHNHKVGIINVEMQPTGSGSFYSMTRTSNQWEYGFKENVYPVVSIPYNIRITGITGEQFVISVNTFTEKTIFTTSVQFADPPDGFGGGYASQTCKAPLPPDVIYDDYLYNGNGASSNAWNDWSFNAKNNPSSTNSPYSGSYCFSSQLDAYGGIQFGRTLGFKWAGEFTELQFAIRADSAFDSLLLFWGGTGQPKLTLKVNTTWQVVTLGLAGDLSSPAEIGGSPATLTIQNNMGSTSPTFYIDEMVFLPRNNASYVNKNFPPGNTQTTGSGASGLQQVPLFVLVFLTFVCALLLL